MFFHRIVCQTMGGWYSVGLVKGLMVLASLFTEGGYDMGKKRFQAEVPHVLIEAVANEQLKGKPDKFIPGTDQMQQLASWDKAERFIERYSKFTNSLNSAPKMRIEDTRAIDMITGKPLSDTNRMHSDAPLPVVRAIINAALENGLDPYTELARAMQETRFKNHNVFTDHTERLAKVYGKYGDYTIDEFVNASMQTVKEKNQIARSLGKTKEEDVLQAWNGYGTVDEKAYPSLYGVKTPIDFNKTPIYGQRLVDLRENVIKKNEELVGMVERARQMMKLTDAGKSLGEL